MAEALDVVRLTPSDNDVGITSGNRAQNRPATARTMATNVPPKAQPSRARRIASSESGPSALRLPVSMTSSWSRCDVLLTDQNRLRIGMSPSSGTRRLELRKSLRIRPATARV